MFGTGEDGQTVKVPLHRGSPHPGGPAGTGAGKSTPARWIDAQARRTGSASEERADASGHSEASREEAEQER